MTYNCGKSFRVTAAVVALAASGNRVLIIGCSEKREREIRKQLTEATTPGQILPDPVFHRPQQFEGTDTPVLNYADPMEFMPDGYLPWGDASVITGFDFKTTGEVTKTAGLALSNLMAELSVSEPATKRQHRPQKIRSGKRRRNPDRWR